MPNYALTAQSVKEEPQKSTELGITEVTMFYLRT